MACWERELTLVHIHTFLTKVVMEGFPRWEIISMPGSTSETTQTWKTIHTIHALIHSNKANTKGWLWRPNDIQGPCGPKASWHLSGILVLKTSPRKLVPAGDWTWAHCMTGAHVAACSTAVDTMGFLNIRLTVMLQNSTLLFFALRFTCCDKACYCDI